jgi:hypothetical protein
MTRSRKSISSADGIQKKRGKKALSLKEEDDEFVVHHIEEDEKEDTTNEDQPEILSESTVVKEEPKLGKKVKVKFGNFVELVANHNFENVVEKNQDEEVIVSSDVLTDLANAHEQEEERRIPAIFIIGVLLGIVVTYILLKY